MIKNITKENIISYLKILNNKYEGSGFQIVSLFGSYARDDNSMFSDIDLTYSIEHDIFYKDDAFAKLIKLEEITNEIKNKFYTNVDLIPANTNNYLMQESLEKEQILI